MKCIKCIRCGREFPQKEKGIQKRKDLDIHIDTCPQCFRVIKSYIKKNRPQELWYLGTKLNPIPWDLYIKYKDLFTMHNHEYVKFNCLVCGKEFINQPRGLKRKTYTKDLNICPNHVMEYVCNLPEWKQKNSEAQKKVQCKDEVKNKIKDSMEVLVKSDPYFAIKRTFGKSNTLRGFYKGIYFASSFELSFLYENQDKQISNCNLYTQYIRKKDQKLHYYFPDFIMDNYIVEVKGNKGSLDSNEKNCFGDYINKCNAGKKLAKEHNMQYLLYDANCIIEKFDEPELLEKIPDDELILTHCPKLWDTKNNKYYYKNKKWVQDLLALYKQDTNRESMMNNIQFFLNEKKLVNKFNRMSISKFTEEYLKVLDSPLFIIFYIFEQSKNGQIKV